MSKSKDFQKRKLIGKVVSDRMDKTVVVRVQRIKTHPKYLKQYKVYKKYKADDRNNEYRIGDQVLIEEVRPISRGKRWRVVEKIN